MVLGTSLVLFLLLFLIKGRKWACNDLLLEVLTLIKVTFDPLSQALKSPLLIVLPEGAASVSAFTE